MEKTSDPTFDSILKRWDEFSDVYTAMDSCPQTFFFTLLNQLKIKEAKNVLEVACGAGLLLPFVVEQKATECQYVATDLSPAMIAKADQRLRRNFEKYESKLTFDEWTKKNNLVVKQVNGEESIDGFGKFDRIICNLVLMLTVNPKNILLNAHKNSTDDALIGITVWGDKAKSNFFSLTGKAFKALGLPLPDKRSPFYYQDIILDDLKETGWELVCHWEQVAPFALTQPDDIEPYLSTLKEPFEGMAAEDGERVRRKIKELFIETLVEKVPVVMSNKLYIAKKIKPE